MKDWKLVTEATCHIIAFFLLVLDCSCINADLWKWNGCYYQPPIWMINGTVWCMISQVEPASNLIFILWPSEVIIDPCSNQHNDQGWFCNNICDLSVLIRTWNMKTKTTIQLVICIHICTKQMKIKRFISGTCGRIKPDVSNVKPGLHVSLFGSINSRKAANVKQSSFARLFYFTVQCTVIGNGFMCKIKQT